MFGTIIPRAIRAGRFAGDLRLFRPVFDNFHLLFPPDWGYAESVKMGFIENPAISKHWLDGSVQPLRGVVPMPPSSGRAGVAPQPPDGSKSIHPFGCSYNTLRVEIIL